MPSRFKKKSRDNNGLFIATGLWESKGKALYSASADPERIAEALEQAVEASEVDKVRVLILESTSDKSSADAILCFAAVSEEDQKKGKRFSKSKPTKKSKPASKKRREEPEDDDNDEWEDD